MTNRSVLILENNPKVKVVTVQIPSRNNFNGCVYKTQLLDLKRGDKVVVPYGGLFNFEIGIVDDVETAEVDPNAEFDYRWIAQKIDEDSYQKILEAEEAVIEGR